MFIDGVPVSLQVVRIEVETERWIGEARLPGAEFVDLEIRLDKVPDAQGGRFIDEIFQLETRVLDFVDVHPVAVKVDYIVAKR